jgi:hypothetical protein
MTIPEKKDIPARTGAGNVGESGQYLSDTSLEPLTGGTASHDESPGCCVDHPGVDLDMVEGSIRLKPGSDVPVVDK